MMKRGAVTKKGSELVSVWIPLPLFHGLERAVQTQDTDRSKLIRAALREKLQRKPAAVGNGK
jgi:metal-responsive CopG/Arc/MetJ family transcriptional regulator